MPWRAIDYLLQYRTCVQTDKILCGGHFKPIKKKTCNKHILNMPCLRPRNHSLGQLMRFLWSCLEDWDRSGGKRLCGRCRDCSGLFSLLLVHHGLGFAAEKDVDLVLYARGPGPLYEWRNKLFALFVQKYLNGSCVKFPCPSPSICNCNCKPPSWIPHRHVFVDRVSEWEREKDWETKERCRR